MGQDPLIGKVLHDTHEVVRLIGQGGMGAVYEAVHTRLRKQRFAIKVLHQKMAESKQIFTRFQREAEIATEIGHPNIVYVLDFYEEQGLPCMVMEYLEGQDLHQRLDGGVRLAPGEVLEIVRQVGGALQAVHDKGIVHRDLKPANIFLVKRADGSTKVKVLDFGISKIRDSSTLTGDSAVLGTPHYMSPEQGEGQVKDVDHRTDIFALGTICYQALTGVRPFDAPTLLGVIRAICDKQPEPLTVHVPGLGEGVDAVINRALAKRKEDRYDRARDFVADLAEALEGVAGDEDEDDLELNESLLRTTAWQPAVSADDAEKLLAQRPATGQEQLGRAADPPAPAPMDMTNLMGIDEVLAGEADPGMAPTASRAGAVSPLTTLSGAAGAVPAEAAPAGAPRKKATVKAMAAAAALALAAGGLYIALRSPDPARHPTTAAAVVQPETERPNPPLTRPAPEPPPATSVPAPKPIKPASEAAKPAAEPARIAPAAKPQTVKFTLRVTPPSSRVLLDGKPRTDNPLVLERSPRQRRLKLEARGYRPATRTIRASADATLTIRLQPRTGARRRPRRGANSDEGFDALGTPRPRRRPRAKPEKTDEEAFDSL